MSDLRSELDEMIKRHGGREVSSFLAEWLAEREEIKGGKSDLYSDGREFARENRRDMEGMLLFKQGLIDEIISWDHREGIKRLTKKIKGRAKHADETKKQH